MRRAYFIFSLPDFLFLFRQQGRIGTFDITASDFQPPLIADKLDTLRVGIIFTIRLFGHHDTISIFHRRIFCAFISFRDKLDWTGSVHTDGRLCNIEHMSPPIGCISVSGFLIPAPCPPQLLVLFGFKRDRRTKIRMIMNLRIVQRSHPLIEIQITGDIHFRQVQWLGGFADTGVYLFDMTDLTGTNQRNRILKLLTRTLLATDLENPIIIAYGTSNSQTFRNRISQRLLTINILTALTSMDSNQCMPVVRCCHFNHVDILTVQHIFIKFIHIATGSYIQRLLPSLDTTFETFTFQGIHVTTGSDLHPRTSRETLKIG